MSATDSIPPEEPSLRTQVRAMGFQLEGLTRLLLGLESACRELIGEVRADRQARAAEAAQEAQPHAATAAAVSLFQSLSADPIARAWIGRAVALLLASVAVWLLASVEILPGSPLTGLFSILDHYLSPGGTP